MRRSASVPAQLVGNADGETQDILLRLNLLSRSLEDGSAYISGVARSIVLAGVCRDVAILLGEHDDARRALDALNEHVCAIEDGHASPCGADLAEELNLTNAAEIAERETAALLDVLHDMACGNSHIEICGETLATAISVVLRVHESGRAARQKARAFWCARMAIPE